MTRAERIEQFRQRVERWYDEALSRCVDSMLRRRGDFTDVEASIAGLIAIEYETRAADIANAIAEYERFIDECASPSTTH